MEENGNTVVKYNRNIEIFLNICAVVFALIFLIYGWTWNPAGIIVGYPAGIISLILYLLNRKRNKNSKLNLVAKYILIFGLSITIIAGFFFLIKANS